MARVRNLDDDADTGFVVAFRIYDWPHSTPFARPTAQNDLGPAHEEAARPGWVVHRDDLHPRGRDAVSGDSPAVA